MMCRGARSIVAIDAASAVAAALTALLSHGRRPGRRRLFISGGTMRYSMIGLIVAGVLAIGTAGTASAKSGSISNVHQISSDGVASADYSATFTSADCDRDGYCGWFPYAVEIPASSPCPASGVSIRLVTYVGTFTPSPGRQVATQAFYPDRPSQRLCLYITHASSDAFIAEAVYNAPVPPSPTPPAPSPEPTATTPVTVSPLGIVEARAGARKALHHRFGHRYAQGKTKKLNCTLISDQRARCRYSFINSRYRYSGHVTVVKDNSGTEGKVTGKRRKR
jgi:hypothetical protein